MEDAGAVALCTISAGAPSRQCQRQRHRRPIVKFYEKWERTAMEWLIAGQDAFQDASVALGASPERTLAVAQG
jgi:hypothetical protein